MFDFQNTLFGIFFSPMMSFILGFNFGGKKKQDPQPQVFTPPPFTGERPFTAGAVGLGAEALRPLSEQFSTKLTSELKKLR